MDTCKCAFNIFWLSLFLDFVLIFLRELSAYSGETLVIGALSVTSASFVMTGKKVVIGVTLRKDFD